MGVECLKDLRAATVMQHLISIDPIGEQCADCLLIYVHIAVQPVQALDEATGYLIAAAAIRGVTARLTRGTGLDARLSLARTAKLLIDQGEGFSAPPFTPESEADVAPAIEATAWGEARRLVPPVAIEGVPMRWDSPAADLGSAEPAWPAS